MAPLGVRVITVMSGVVHTNIFANNPEPDLPDDSLWKGAQKEVSDNATGTAQSPMDVSPEEFAKGVVDSVLGRSNGQIFKGGMAGFGWAVSSFLPTWLLVSTDLPESLYMESLWWICYCCDADW
jgi:hypothetical protein